MKKPFLLTTILFFFISLNSFSQTIVTAAGTVTWTVSGTNNINEVTLTENTGSHGDGFDGAMMVNVTGTNITFTNAYHLSNTYGAAVQEVIINNTGGTASTFTLSSTGNLGSDGSTIWHYTSSINNRYTVSSDNASATSNGGDPVISIIYGNAALNAYTTAMPFSNGSDAASFTLSNVPIAAGATKRFLIVAGVGNIDDALSNRPDQALLAVTNLTNSNNWPADFTNYLSAAQKATVMNWSALSTLPLTWKDFTAQSQLGNVLLNWTTANETNTKNFIVQHSMDGTNWFDIATINAAGNSMTDRNYSFIHVNPSKGNNYYRILQNDLDANKSYSAIRKAVIDNVTGSFVVLNNPVKNNMLTLQLNEKQSISIFSADGKKVLEQQLNAGTQQVDVSKLPNGFYIVKFSAGAAKILISR